MFKLYLFVKIWSTNESFILFLYKSSDLFHIRRNEIFTKNRRHRKEKNCFVWWSMRYDLLQQHPWMGEISRYRNKCRTDQRRSMLLSNFWQKRNCIIIWLPSIMLNHGFLKSIFPICFYFLAFDSDLLALPDTDPSGSRI